MLGELTLRNGEEYEGKSSLGCRPSSYRGQ
jgi:hypothetical protein